MAAADIHIEEVLRLVLPEGSLLILLLTSLALQTLGFALAFPYGTGSALAASVVFGAASIVLIGVWLAFAAERQSKPPKLSVSL